MWVWYVDIGASLDELLCADIQVIYRGDMKWGVALGIGPVYIVCRLSVSVHRLLFTLPNVLEKGHHVAICSLLSMGI